jgi:hypothetical protein
MRIVHLFPAVLALVALTGCKDKEEKRPRQDNLAVGSALGLTQGPLAQAASAQALASAMVAQTAVNASVTGKMSSVGGELGTWNVSFAECSSGESRGFFGVDFYVAGSDELRLRYVHDEANGDVVKFGIPGKSGNVIVPDRKQCTVSGTLEKTNVQSWTPKGNIRHLNGHVKFDCKLSEGKGHVTGEATFTSCH